MTDRMAHRITPLSSTSIPSRHVVIDTEAELRLECGVQVQRWQIGAAAFLHRGSDARMTATPPQVYASPVELWAAIDRYCRSRGRVVVWAHNLSYDLRVSRGLIELPRLGWRLQGIVLERSASWASFTNGQRSLLCCDLASWLPTSLAEIAGDVGGTRPDFDYASAELGHLELRCCDDVAITMAAVMHLLAFLEGQDCGPFRPTGAGQSHAAWRRRFMSHTVVAHDDQVALEAERTAMWTGRCEAWQHGYHDTRGIVEWDLQLAYCHIAAECSVPTRLVGGTGPMTHEQFTDATERYAVLCEVDAGTASPMVPHGYDDRIHWPVGRFTTTLWDPEVRVLLAGGADVVIRRAWVYDRAPALSEMAQWILSALTDTWRSHSAVARRLLKHWSRTIVGRMALRYRQWEKFGTTETDDLELGLYVDLGTGQVTDALQVGCDYMTLADLSEAASSLPQITGWVMSEARRRLWSLMVQAGMSNVLYVDTDSVITNAAGSNRLRRAIRDGAAWSLTEKTRVRSVEIQGPRNLVVHGERRTSGIPLRARRTGVDTYEGEVWRSIKQSMTRGELDRVVVIPRKFVVNAPDRRRDHLPGGLTKPHTIGGLDV